MPHINVAILTILNSITYLLGNVEFFTFFSMTGQIPFQFIKLEIDNLCIGILWKANYWKDSGFNTVYTGKIVGSIQFILTTCFWSLKKIESYYQLWFNPFRLQRLKRNGGTVSDALIARSLLNSDSPSSSSGTRRSYGSPVRNLILPVNPHPTGSSQSRPVSPALSRSSSTRWGYKYAKWVIKGN